MKYIVIIEKSETSYGAYVPDLPGCVAAETEDRSRNLFEEAIAFHIEGLIEEGELIPEPSSASFVIEVPTAA